MNPMLSDSEWRIMSLLWERPMTMPDIKKALDAETGWSRHTIISFLNRMIAKGAVEMEDKKPLRVYKALLPKDASLEGETRSFVRRLFGGKAGLLAASLVEREEMSDAEIDELMTLLERRRKKGENHE